MRYLLALDTFKGALPAMEANRIAAATIRATQPGAECDLAPLTDGGEGFAAILAAALGGTVRVIEVPGPRFAPVPGRLALVPGARVPPPAWEILRLDAAAREGPLALVEMASASGYECLAPAQRDPWQTSTIGTGALLREAAHSGARAIVLGIGGSATNDCGAGALEALGVVYHDHARRPVARITPARFREVAGATADPARLATFPPVRIACDVTNPLLGPRGATRVFGRQKGLREEDTERMEAAVQRMAHRLLQLFGREPGGWEALLREPGTGAAGGIGFALRQALPDSRFVEGFALVAAMLDLPARIAAADCVVTGEGRLDESSLDGKGPVALLRLAGPDKPALFLAGSISGPALKQLQQEFPLLEAYTLSDPSWPLEKALAETPAALQAALYTALTTVP